MENDNLYLMPVNVFTDPVTFPGRQGNSLRRNLASRNIRWTGQLIHVHPHSIQRVSKKPTINDHTIEQLKEVLTGIHGNLFFRAWHLKNIMGYERRLRPVGARGLMMEIHAFPDDEEIARELMIYYFDHAPVPRWNEHVEKTLGTKFSQANVRKIISAITESPALRQALIEAFDRAREEVIALGPTVQTLETPKQEEVPLIKYLEFGEVGRDELQRDLGSDAFLLAAQKACKTVEPVVRRELQLAIAKIDAEILEI